MSTRMVLEEMVGRVRERLYDRRGEYRVACQTLCLGCASHAVEYAQQ